MRDFGGKDTTMEKIANTAHEVPYDGNITGSDTLR
jgi:hypothetical protein